MTNSRGYETKTFLNKEGTLEKNTLQAPSQRTKSTWKLSLNVTEAICLMCNRMEAFWVSDVVSDRLHTFSADHVQPAIIGAQMFGSSSVQQECCRESGW
jgi:hypothetical protein